jgi:hypothetical protein
MYFIVQASAITRSTITRSTITKMMLHGMDKKENKDNATLPNKTPFVCKDIVKKKKNPQQRLEMYFPVTKQRVMKGEKIFQGFPLTECIYEEEINKYVFKPRKYPANGTSSNSIQQHSLCHKCFLRPCFVKGKWDDLMGFCEDIMIFENDDSGEGMYFCDDLLVLIDQFPNKVSFLV